MPDPNFLSLLHKNMVLALAILHRDFSRTPRTDADRFRLLRRLLSVVNLCFLKPSSSDIFFDPTFEDVLYGIILNARSYDL